MRSRRVELDAPIRFLLTGDTHFGARIPKLPRELVDSLDHVDVLIHTGDFTSQEGFDHFQQINKPMLAVAGNNDHASFSVGLPDYLEITVDMTTILVTHGHLERGRSARTAVIDQWAGKVGIVVFGHSHQPICERVDGTLFVNPGSPRMKRRAPRFSFGNLVIDENSDVTASLTYFDANL